MCCNNCNKFYLPRDVSMERNPMYFQREIGGSSLDLLRSITPKTRAYVVEGNRIVKEVTEELFRRVNNTYYPFEEGATYMLPLSEAFVYASDREDFYDSSNSNGVYRKPEETRANSRRDKESSSFGQQRDELKELIDRARAQLQINSN